METNPIVEIFRAVVRPAITIMFGAAIVHLVTQGITPPTWFLSFAIPIITWWFGEKTLTHIKENKVE
jgi:hypothetical protein